MSSEPPTQEEKEASEALLREAQKKVHIDRRERYEETPVVVRFLDAYRPASAARDWGARKHRSNYFPREYKSNILRLNFN